ncbi:integrin alpha-6b isoform X2 [Silurus meridionalis]|uniref:integrin alpha-6b isoform X2 n=1 Tax=Silurus meridionalis TaxID=175797 RepID=UPI001EECEC82|nr:integrin alpha-6b isoform X2 [Silurus meridionalis]
MDMTRYRTLTLCLICLLECGLISAFNLDTENVIRKKGEKNSLFGFSLALHRQLKPTDKKMLLVGAPRAKKLPNQKSQITGGLYNCDISSTDTACPRVIFDNCENLDQESKDNQWMGVTVQSQGPGGKIVTCAHRYQKRLNTNLPQESRDITGRCYVLSQELKIDESTGDEGGDWSFCEGRSRGHERFGSCQQGLSVTFTRDYHYLVFGAPGAFNWKGVVRLEQKNNTLIEMGIYDDGPYEIKYTTPEALDEVAVPANSYLGFSLDTGKMLTKKGQLTVVAGAPRANHSGAVVLLKKESDSGSKMITEYIIEGEGLASSFGYEVAVVDLNGDGWQDLVVGAPQFFVKDGDIGGAVYVYINRNGDWDKATKTRIDGAKNSMFGLAIENLGDLNLDGFNDVAIGAPYDDEGAGNVYIYHGSSNGLKKEPSQVLKGLDLNIKMFGYSLAGNMDLDNNEYPDLAIGSLSDTVVMYRARPVVNIEKTVTTTPKEIDLTKKNCGDSICLQVEICFKFTSNAKKNSPNIKIKYFIQVDAKRKKLGLPSRAIFSPPSSTDTDFESTGEMILGKENENKCITKSLKLQDNLKDMLRAIPIEVNVEIVKPSGRKKRQASMAQLSPVLAASQPSLTEVNFVKEGCGDDLRCQSNLKLEYNFFSRERSQDIFEPLPLENGVPVISLSHQQEIALGVTVTNKNGDDAYESVLTASFSNSLSYSAIRTKTPGKQIFCAVNQNGSKAECEIGNPFKKDSEFVFYIILSTGGIALDTSEVDVTLELKTTSDQAAQTVTKKANVVMEMLLTLSGVAKPSQLEFSGKVKGESAMMTESDIGSEIDYEFRVINLGKPLKSFGTAFLNIEWPKNTATKKWLLYLMKITTTGTDTINCRPDEVNTLNFNQEPSRTKREAKDEGGSKEKEGVLSSLFSDKRKSKILTCEDGASCVTLKCPLQGLDSNAVIALKARMWNSTFIEDFSDMNYVDIIVKASLNLDSAPKNLLLKNKETQVRVTVFPVRKAAQYGGLPWWIILVAILLGLLLLGLLVFLLWKCGFFKRSKYSDSVPSYNAVRIKKEERRTEKPTSVEKKQWMTSWNENESYS